MKRKTMGWLIVFLLFIVYMLNYMDRSALSITAPLIETTTRHAQSDGVIARELATIPLSLWSQQLQVIDPCVAVNIVE